MAWGFGMLFGWGLFIFLIVALALMLSYQGRAVRLLEEIKDLLKDKR